MTLGSELPSEKYMDKKIKSKTNKTKLNMSCSAIKPRAKLMRV